MFEQRGKRTGESPKIQLFKGAPCQKILKLFYYGSVTNVFSIPSDEFSMCKLVKFTAD